MTDYYVLANHSYIPKPIEVWWDGSGPHIRTSKRSCEIHGTIDEAYERLTMLQSHNNTAKRAKSLAVRQLSECGIVIP